ncbi:MAG: Cell envelope-associated transcriptional attenuator LytR-CpsA-Psr, subfamily A1 [uncultured Nocardioides sp.]|uniref:Cell envelope-associated transcriptional attenuator LytR-CpsA-Psr, subfamily A1 n=1 Tax=uncultured Nocardioides sp. TaxID=198441 RepID=A0A6J4MUE3_9ACTN|nr:MAG: Cell envelope-associated transcriptional attenuator LytR-CpsA-Psr, subfamily A1 [uncultured Nocardioides sp.]
MADRPRGSGTPEEGTPEYEWLYGKKGQAPSDDATRVVPTQAARPDETRVMPATRPAPAPTGGRPAAGAPQPAPRPAPERPAKVQRARRFPRFRFRFGFLKLLLLLVLAFLVGVPIYAYSQIEKVDAEPEGKRPKDQPGTNYLIVGSDKADDLTNEQREALQTGPRGGTNTDTIIVLHTGSGPDTMMSIPRDTLAEVPGEGTRMINSAFSVGGPPRLVATVEQLTGIHIDHYVELGFGSVINTVDALGGVEVCPKTAMKDPKARLDVEKGCQEVDGETALAYSRSRYVSALSDLDRVARQREVISALGSKAKSPWTFVNPLRYWRVNQAAADAIRIDEEMNPIDLGRFALAMTGDNRTCTMPNLPAPSDPNRLVPDPDRAPAVFEAIIADEQVPKASCTPTGRARQ